MKYMLLLLVLQIYFGIAFSQSCNQPGALLTVRTAHSGGAEYVIFTFVDPHKPKGELSKTGNGPFIQMPLGNQVQVKGDHYHKIIFNNSPVNCETRNYITTGKKILDLKRLQNADGIISYIVGLAKDAAITSHMAYNYHGFHIVKLKVQ